MEQSENTAAEEPTEEAKAETEEQLEANLPPTAQFAQQASIEECEQEETEAEAENPDESEEEEKDDPILILQLLQIRDREYFAAIKKLQTLIEDTKDEQNGVVEEVFQINAGFSGFIRKALRGSNVPPTYARLLESIQHKLDVLKSQRNFLGERLDIARQLAAEAELAADSHNTMVFRKRSISELELHPDDAPLVEANRRVEMFRKLLNEEIELEELEAEEIHEEEEEAEPREKRTLGTLTAHFEEYKEQKTVELTHKILETDIGKKGLKRLEALADKLEQKREAKYAGLRNLSAVPQSSSTDKE